jgi:hypothetical protein
VDSSPGGNSSPGENSSPVENSSPGENSFPGENTSPGENSPPPLGSSIGKASAVAKTVFGGFSRDITALENDLFGQLTFDQSLLESSLEEEFPAVSHSPLEKEDGAEEASRTNGAELLELTLPVVDFNFADMLPYEGKHNCCIKQVHRMALYASFFHK